ncbi:hypothetical protein LK996_00945 [Lysobacter sp. A6]|uniref:Uncharacterized protein n=1 Tax=Noviluteimonas lactosilytica TaxID=2888523 RepID=A0ABS8JDG2_9GAMM|nr:hypothetical protein [Lysobacter lactosilyticus]MCC8361651.1 hypothetical protein [Lysobacter lactosilyticus]
MDLQDLGNLAQAIGAATVVAGSIFALIQFIEYKRQRQDAVAAEVMRTFIGAEFCRAMTLLLALPDSVSGQRLREEGAEAQYAAVLVCCTVETLGILVYKRIAPFPLVVELAGGIIVVMWRKLGAWCIHIRNEQRQPSWAEWFEWLAKQCAKHKDETYPAYVKHIDWTPSRR